MSNGGSALLPLSEFTLAKASGLKKGELILNKQTLFFWLGQAKLFYALSEMDELPKGEFSVCLLGLLLFVWRAHSEMSCYDEVQMIGSNQFQLVESQSGKSVTLGTYSRENMSSWASAIAV